MTDYNKIAADVQVLMDYLEVPQYSDGSLRDLQDRVNDMANLMLDINNAIRDVDERVTLLE